MAISARAGWIALGLVVLAGLGLHAARTSAPSALPVADSSPACDSCDARHAHLAVRRAEAAEGKE